MVLHENRLYEITKSVADAIPIILPNGRRMQIQVKRENYEGKNYPRFYGNLIKE